VPEGEAKAEAEPQPSVGVARLARSDEAAEDGRTDDPDQRDYPIPPWGRPSWQRRRQAEENHCKLARRAV